MLKRVSIASLALDAAICAASAQEKSTDLAIVVAKASSFDNVSSLELLRIFEMEKSKDGDGHKLIVTARESNSPERAAALTTIYKMDDGEYQTYFLRAVFAGRASGKPQQLNSAAAVRRFVAATPGAIGYLLASDVDDSIKIVKVDGKAPGEAGYPLKAP